MFNKKEKIEIRTAYDSVPCYGLSCPEPTLTVQSEKDNCDINLIIKRSEKSGILPVRSDYANAMFGDFTEIPDYQTALNAVNAANETFMSLPAEIREQFSNDPAKFVDFAMDEANIDKLRDLGLANPKQKEATAQGGAEAATTAS